MTIKVYWMKRNHHELYAQVTKTKTYILMPANRVRMGFGNETPQGQLFDSVFVPVYAPYDVAYGKWKDEDARTKTVTHEFIAAEKAMKKSFQQLYKGYIKDNMLITAGDLDGVGLPQRSSGERHPAPVAKKAPDVDVDTSVTGHVGIHFYEKEGNHKRGKPDGQHCVEIIWIIAGITPTRWDELIHSVVDTNSPYVFSFENDQRGQTLHFALRWENTRGEKGPWSNIQSVIIP